MRELMLQLYHVPPAALAKLVALGLDRIELGSSALRLDGSTLADACALLDGATSKRLRNGWCAVFESTCNGVTVATTTNWPCAHDGGNSACVHDGVAHIGPRPHALTHDTYVALVETLHLSIIYTFREVPDGALRGSTVPRPLAILAAEHAKVKAEVKAEAVTSHASPTRDVPPFLTPKDEPKRI
ncbi:hypothetical protein SDRG_07442 [Saprolegnia diclina VS20]|uniref:Uncharacterized protein n=1 Tax=Saprolegnia diclina (strain VS20) TaxID=1156394 RepID=T0RRT3_SAPDV|nr:hypothetical protein SDRG_07442 [Saprolegnia diclina VS20]EQC35213.1 hypothetical protein SDRG_07442 [Saprolegnia diclina VS20]|eukprot:XP_008611497.1 hypothetical protein SDRG_07442 [Saprolegnia diclina VS20]